MLKQIKEEVISIYNTLHDAGFEVYLVGGCVRDLLVNKPVKDWDLTTNATPEHIQSLFKDSFYDNTFGTVGIPLKSLEEVEHPGVVEITTFRREGKYVDRRRPESVSWGTSLEEDLSRRDLTINAMAMRILSSQNGASSEIETIDPFGGQEDLKNNIIRTVGNPQDRFQEDALRLMRAIRFAAELGFTIEENTWNSIVKHAQLITQISNERIRDELLKILASDYPYEGIKLLDNAGMLAFILPELTKGKGISQERPGRHHKTDVFTHNILSLKFCPSKDPIIRFTTLLHDVGKPYSVGYDEHNFVVFYNHEVTGAKIARNIAERLRLSRKQKEKVYTLIRWHMFTVDEKITDAAVRRFIRRVGIENVKDIIDLRIGDRLGGGTQRAESWRLKLFKKRVEQQLAPKPFSMQDLAVDGHDVMRELSIPPGPKVGEILQTLFEEVDEDLSKNTREYLLTRIKNLGQR